MAKAEGSGRCCASVQPMEGLGQLSLGDNGLRELEFCLEGIRDIF